MKVVRTTSPMRARMRPFHQLREARSRGQAAVEFALLLPLLAILVAGVVDVGRGFHARVVLTNAVREGARHGAGAPDDEDGILEAVHHELATTSVRGIEDDDITISTPDGTDARDPLTVSASFEFQPFLGLVLGIDSIPIRTSATMMILPGL